ncbi:hypothetical protein CNY89_28995, partial [Amaricoccus sp. HAR-UPW-R2A-40]
GSSPARCRSAIPQGRVLRWFGTCTDIHDYKATEREKARDRGAADAGASTGSSPARCRSAIPQGRVLRWFGTCTDIHDYKAT